MYAFVPILLEVFFVLLKPQELYEVLLSFKPLYTIPGLIALGFLFDSGRYGLGAKRMASPPYVWWALGFFYTAAADRLVHCGARVDNLLFAAGAGDLEAVKCYFDGQGRLRADRAHSWGRSVAPARKLDTDHMLEYALIYAAAHGRCPVVELLLSKGPDLAIKEPMWKNTALDAAEHARRPDLVARISALGGPGRKTGPQPKVET